MGVKDNIQLGRIVYFRETKLKPWRHSTGAKASNYFCGVMLGHVPKGTQGGVDKNTLHRMFGHMGWVHLELVKEAVGEELFGKVVDLVKAKFPIPSDNEEQAPAKQEAPVEQPVAQ